MRVLDTVHPGNPVKFWDGVTLVADSSLLAAFPDQSEPNVISIELADGHTWHVDERGLVIEFVTRSHVPVLSLTQSVRIPHPHPSEDSWLDLAEAVELPA